MSSFVAGSMSACEEPPMRFTLITVPLSMSYSMPYSPFFNTDEPPLYQSMTMTLSFIAFTMSFRLGVGE